MPKIGFVDCLSNSFDSLDLANAVIEANFAGTSLQRLTAPELLKVPVCVKKLLVSEVDAVVVFVNALPEDLDALHLVVEKTIDLEIAHQKYVFYCVVNEDEFSNQAEFDEISKKRLLAVFDVALKALHSPAEVSSQIGTGMDFSMFASFAENAQLPGTEPTPEEKQPNDTGGNSLF